jgi:Fis family transcriptional regulator, factor for inversion stimulation protein
VVQIRGDNNKKERQNMNTATANATAGFLLRNVIKDNVERYLEQTKGIVPINLYDLILEEIEEPLLKFLMQKARNNQCKVTRWLGLSRGTVRKKLKKYGLID